LPLANWFSRISEMPLDHKRNVNIRFLGFDDALKKRIPISNNGRILNVLRNRAGKNMSSVLVDESPVMIPCRRAFHPRTRLPYAMLQKRPASLSLVRWCLKFPWICNFLGNQFLVFARALA
jgi:hypothetical protein